MRTSFTDSEDKLLVQIAFQFEREGLRITWDYVGRRMKTKRTARQLQIRLSNLKRTYGKSLSDFPPCFFSGMTSRRLLRARGPPPPRPHVSQQSTCVPSEPQSHVQGFDTRDHDLGVQSDCGYCTASVTGESVAVVGAGEPDGNDITTVDVASGQALSAERLRQGARHDQEATRGPRPGGADGNGESAAILAFDGDRDARKHAVRGERGGRVGRRMDRAACTSAATIGSCEVVDGVSMVRFYDSAGDKC
ncbi:hypothetical protein PF002_g15868 [Phytophthora fragariae]|uniref:Myb-like domain-containing protein n=2 Tax=Phytophthora fragariae TaxID=53985 RepID=A0A6A3YK84_9STRA|nr:hypothetical protein PF011_g20836 [Phytophthora fragariae]KAE9220523.1 hypothetical protein PF002_g15868 [Phytophthora fragariae]KAE9281910.1 hypothetical protein PF001_g23562 [Phytophthora fragariae]